MYCIYCDAETPNTVLYCTSCNRQFDRALKTPLITCSSCRVDNPNDAVYCWHCGKRLEREKVAGVILSGIVLGGAIGGGAAKAILSQSSQAAPHVEQGLAHPAAVIDAGQGLGHPAPNIGHGLGLTPSPMPAPSSPSSPTLSAAPSAPPASPTPASPLPASQPAVNPTQVAAQPTQTSGEQAIPHTSAAPHVPPHPRPVHTPVPHVPPHLQPVHTPAPHVPSLTQPVLTLPHEPAPQYLPTPSHPLETAHHHGHTLHHPGHLHHTATRKVLSGGLKLTTHLSRRALLMAIAGGTAAVVVGGTLVYVSQSQSSPEKTFQTYIDAMKNGDAQTAYNQLSSHLQSQVSEQQLASVVSNSGGYLNGANYTTSNVQVTGSTATAMVSVSVAGLTETASVQFVMENGAWKIDGGTIINFQPSGG